MKVSFEIVDLCGGTAEQVEKYAERDFPADKFRNVVICQIPLVQDDGSIIYAVVRPVEGNPL